MRERNVPLPLSYREETALLGIGQENPQIKSLKMVTGEEMVAIVVRKGRRHTTLAVPMKIVYDDLGAVHLVPWMTAAVKTENGIFVWSDQPFEINSSAILAECWPLDVVKEEYRKRLSDPQTWLNNREKDIDSFSLPDNVKIQ